MWGRNMKPEYAGRLGAGAVLVAAGVLIALYSYLSRHRRPRGQDRKDTNSEAESEEPYLQQTEVTSDVTVTEVTSDVIVKDNSQSTEREATRSDEKILPALNVSLSHESHTQGQRSEIESKTGTSSHDLKVVEEHFEKVAYTTSQAQGHSQDFLSDEVAAPDNRLHEETEVEADKGEREALDALEDALKLEPLESLSVSEDNDDLLASSGEGLSPPDSDQVSEEADDSARMRTVSDTAMFLDSKQTASREDSTSLHSYDTLSDLSNSECKPGEDGSVSMDIKDWSLIEGSPAVDDSVTGEVSGTERTPEEQSNNGGGDFRKVELEGHSQDSSAGMVVSKDDELKTAGNISSLQDMDHQKGNEIVVSEHVLEEKTQQETECSVSDFKTKLSESPKEEIDVSVAMTPSADDKQTTPTSGSHTEDLTEQKTVEVAADFSSFTTLLDNTNLGQIRDEALTLSEGEMKDALAMTQKSPDFIFPSHARILVLLLAHPDPQLQQAALDNISRCAAFVRCQNLLREHGCLLRLSELLQVHSMSLHLGHTSAEVFVTSIANALTNLAVNEENHKQLEGCVPALVDLSLDDLGGDAVCLSSLQALTNLSVTPLHHGQYTRLVQKLYELLDTANTERVKVQALKILVNLSCNPEMIPHLLAAKAPACLLDLLQLDPSSEPLTLRWVTLLAHIAHTVKEKNLTASSLPTDEKAPSPEMMYSALYGVNSVGHLRNKVFLLCKHDNEDVRNQAASVYADLSR